jgi:hypothetical protein
MAHYWPSMRASRVVYTRLIHILVILSMLLTGVSPAFAQEPILPDGPEGDPQEAAQAETTDVSVDPSPEPQEPPSPLISVDVITTTTPPVEPPDISAPLGLDVVVDPSTLTPGGMVSFAWQVGGWTKDTRGLALSVNVPSGLTPADDLGGTTDPKSGAWTLPVETANGLAQWSIPENLEGPYHFLSPSNHLHLRGFHPPDPSR